MLTQGEGKEWSRMASWNDTEANEKDGNLYLAKTGYYCKNSQVRH